MYQINALTVERKKIVSISNRIFFSNKYCINDNAYQRIVLKTLTLLFYSLIIFNVSAIFSLSCWLGNSAAMETFRINYASRHSSFQILILRSLSQPNPQLRFITLFRQLTLTKLANVIILWIVLFLAKLQVKINYFENKNKKFFNFVNFKFILIIFSCLDQLNQTFKYHAWHNSFLRLSRHEIICFFISSLFVTRKAVEVCWTFRANRRNLKS